VILTKLLKIAMLHLVLNWQKIYKTVSEKAIFGIQNRKFYADLKNANLL
jgi:hypothetical protein